MRLVSKKETWVETNAVLIWQSNLSFVLEKDSKKNGKEMKNLIRIERKIGERFDYKSVKLEVEMADEPYCNGCYFNGETIDCCHRSIRKIIGSCNAFNRSDLKYVIFKLIE